MPTTPPKQSTPSKSAENAWIALLRTRQLLLEHVEAALTAADLPPLAWYDVLLELSRAPDEPLRQFEIGERVLLSKHKLSRLIDRLEKDGLAKRLTCDEDGRGNTVKITKKGLQIKQAMWTVYAQALQVLIEAPLSATQLRALTDMMNILAENLTLTKPS